MKLVGPIVLYSHTDTDEDSEAEIAAAVSRGIPRQLIEDFLLSNPLYEVTYEFYLDADSSTSYCTAVNLGDGRPFTRPAPGQQLNLF